MTVEEIKALQEELGVTVDGIIGPETKAAAEAKLDASRSIGEAEAITEKYSGILNFEIPTAEVEEEVEVEVEVTANSFFEANVDTSDMFGSLTSGTMYIVDSNGGIMTIGSAEELGKRNLFVDGQLKEGFRIATGDEREKWKAKEIANAAALNVSKDLSDKFKLSTPDLEGMMSQYFDAAQEAEAVSGPSTFDRVKGLYPWLDERLVRVYLDKFADSGDAVLAQAEMRADPIMDTVYPGIRREDGTLRMNEEEYVVAIDKMKADLRSFNLNPTEFEEDIIQAISGDVSPLEWQGRLEAGYEGVVNNIPQVKQAYLDNFGIELPDESIFAMFVSPTVATKILEGNIRASQVLGEAEAAGLPGISAQVAASLSKQGLTQETARRGFQAAALNLPNIQASAKAQGRQVLTAADYVEATELGSAEDVEALNRILAQQRSGSTAATGAAQTQTGQTTGLTER